MRSGIVFAVLLLAATVRPVEAAPQSMVLLDRVLDLAKTDVPDLSMLTTEPVARTESSGYGWREDPINKRAKFHHGSDYRGKRGAPVLAAGSGTVIFAGRRGGYGRVVFVDHGSGVITRYAHLRRIDVKVGDTLAAGQQLGQLGSTGRTTGAHLHFEVRLGGRSVDPNTAMIVADIMRDNPAMGRLAAFALAPELQERAQDAESRTVRIPTRPERAGRTKRKQILW